MAAIPGSLYPSFCEEHNSSRLDGRGRQLHLCHLRQAVALPLLAETEVHRPHRFQDWHRAVGHLAEVHEALPAGLYPTHLLVATVGCDTRNLADMTSATDHVVEERGSAEPPLALGNVRRLPCGMPYFGEPENAFLVCTFWYVNALAALDRRDEARALFEKLLACRNRHGLLAEHIDPRSGEQWGNFVQTYSMVGLINAAIRLSVRWDQAF